MTSLQKNDATRQPAPISAAPPTGPGRRGPGQGPGPGPGSGRDSGFGDSHHHGGGGGGSGSGGGGSGDGGFRGRKVTTCSFCGKTSREVGPMVEGPNDIY